MGVTAILDFDPERTDNGQLIADVAKLGYIKRYDFVLDATYGKGTFWKSWKPMHLTHHDIKVDGVDFRDLPYVDDHFDVVVFDPPYKLNGTPSLGDFDDAYGIQDVSDWRDRMRLIVDGAKECARVAGKHLLTKQQDQVVSGQMRWQTDAVTEAVTSLGFRKADRCDFVNKTSQKQPAGRRQVHARHSVSQLLVFKRGRVDNGV